MKQYITLVLFLFIGLFSLTVSAQTVIFSEDFSGITTGDNTTTGGSGTAWTGNTNFTVDANSKAYQAGGAVKLGTGSLVGYITTVPLNLALAGGAFTLTFDVKGWTTVEGSIKVTVTGLNEQTVTYTATMASAFETKTVAFTGGTANSTIRIETTAKRAFIDNVTVTVPDANVNAPVATAATGISFSEFTANWNAVAGATVYYLDVSLAADFSTFVNGYENLEVAGTSQLVTGLTSNTVYYYRVRASDGTIISDDSNVIDLATVCGPFIFPGVEGGQYCGSATVENLPVNEGYQWYATPNGGTPLAQNAPLASGTYYLSQTINGCESERVDFEVEILELPDMPEVEDEIMLCPGSTVSLLTPDGPEFKWYADETGGLALEESEELASGEYYVSQTVGDCESERAMVEVEIGLPEAPAGDTIQDFTEGQTLADLDVDAEDILVWYDDADMTTTLPASTVLVDGTTYYAANLGTGCMSELVPITVNMILGLSSADMPGLQYYPNPVQENLTISYTNNLDSIIVYNMLGQMIFSNTPNVLTVQFDASGLTAGTYFVKVASGAQAKTIKVVKQ